MALGACDHGPLATIRYRMLGLPEAVVGACPASPIAAGPIIHRRDRAVRLTFRDASSLRCDVGCRSTAASRRWWMCRARTRRVDLIVEYVDATGAVDLARGQATAIDLAGAATASGDADIAPASGFACAMGRGGRPRAFHSATLLPTGEVLLVGGLGPADGTDVTAGFAPSTGLFVTASAELYHPASHTFSPVLIPGAVAARAAPGLRGGRRRHDPHRADRRRDRDRDPAAALGLHARRRVPLDPDRDRARRERRDHRLRPGDRHLQPARARSRSPTARAGRRARAARHRRGPGRRHQRGHGRRRQLRSLRRGGARHAARCGAPGSARPSRRSTTRARWSGAATSSTT